MAQRRRLEREIEAVLLHQLMMAVLVRLPREVDQRDMQEDMERCVTDEFPDGHPAVPAVNGVVAACIERARCELDFLRMVTVSDGPEEDCPICVAMRAEEKRGDAS